MCQAFRFMPWAARRCTAHLHFKNGCTVAGLNLKIHKNMEMLISLSSSWTNTWQTPWSLWYFGAYPSVTFPCVAGDNQRTSNLFLMLSPETMELERVSGVNAENPMHGHQIKSANSIGFVVDLCWSMLTYWQDLRGWFGTVYRLQICPTFAA